MIILNTKWALKSDESCISVCKAKRKKGELIYEPKYHYNNFEQALCGIIDRDLQDLNLDNFKDMANRIDELKEYIKKIAPELPLPSVDTRDFSLNGEGT